MADMSHPDVQEAQRLIDRFNSNNSHYIASMTGKNYQDRFAFQLLTADGSVIIFQVSDVPLAECLKHAQDLQTVVDRYIKSRR